MSTPKEYNLNSVFKIKIRITYIDVTAKLGKTVNTGRK